LELAPLALSSGPKSLIDGSQLGLQERALEWLGERSVVIRNIHLHFMICCIGLCVLASGPYEVRIPRRLYAKFGEQGPH
jgi:hypothetical protein